MKRFVQKISEKNRPVEKPKEVNILNIHQNSSIDFNGESINSKVPKGKQSLAIMPKSL